MHLRSSVWKISIIIILARGPREILIEHFFCFRATSRVIGNERGEKAIKWMENIQYRTENKKGIYQLRYGLNNRMKGWTMMRSTGDKMNSIFRSSREALGARPGYNSHLWLLSFSVIKWLAWLALKGHALTLIENINLFKYKINILRTYIELKWNYRHVYLLYLGK